MEIESWKPIPGYSGYEVSDLGRIRSYRVKGGGGPNRMRAEPRLLKPTINAKGYPIVCPVRDRTSHVENVHKLVLLAFVGPRPDGTETRHLDGNKLNTRLDNLCYGTTRENADDNLRLAAYVHDGDHPRSRLTPDVVVELRTLWATGLSRKTLAKRFCISVGHVKQVVLGRTWKQTGGPIARHAHFRGPRGTPCPIDHRDSTA